MGELVQVDFKKKRESKEERREKELRQKAIKRLLEQAKKLKW